MDIKIDQALENLRKQTIATLEDRVNQKSDVKKEVQNEVKVAMTAIQKDLSEDYQKCLTM
jgi:hypothetical protein